MNFVAEYLNSDSQSRANILSSWLHGIKNGSESECFAYFSDFDFSLLTAETKQELVKISVYIEYAFTQKFKRIPLWVLDDRLVMDIAYLGRGYTEAWLVMGAQACLRHNYFIDVGAMTVI